MIKNIIFDWSGVIKDSIHDHLYAVNKIFQKFGAQQMSLEQLKENWIQPYMLFYNKYLPELTMEQEIAIYKKAIMECAPRPYPGIADLIKDLQIKGVKMVVVSSDLAETVIPEMKNFGLNNLFLEVATEINDKPAVTEELIKKYSFNKSETLIIGDSNHEIEAGRLAGVRTAAVTWGFTLESRLMAEHPDFVVHNLEELRLLFSGS